LIDSGVEVLFADLPQFNGAMGRFMRLPSQDIAWEGVFKLAAASAAVALTSERDFD
jgi:hypothetical protein